MPGLYIALYRSSQSTIFHWAIVAAHTDDLSQPLKAYHIRMAGGPWERGQSTVNLLQTSDEFVCCVALPPLIAPLADAERVLAAQPIEQGATPLISYYKQWSCEQWALRAISELVAQNCLPAAPFHIPHPRWKDIVYVDVNMCAHRALTDKNAGQNVNGVPVFSLPM
ncbi:hypothetical protein A0H81_06514 [Grifola frondosa]|uniref:Uncharacterized protein n=1 Tax=Grifola frondosa TaxID=5627 RepID=A0A1C7MCB7_GRIFR|nr:hypothetical protein A0H81_06514 [Grifola frondosa]